MRIRERLLRRSPFRRVRIGALTHAVSLCVCVCACACACVMWAYRLIQNVASIIDIETLQSWSLQGTKRLVLGGLGGSRLADVRPLNLWGSAGASMLRGSKCGDANC